MTIELDLDFHLVEGNRFAADRAGGSDPWAAEPTVGTLRGELSSPDRFSGLLSEAVVGDRFISSGIRASRYRVPTRTGWKRQPSIRRTLVKPACSMSIATRSVVMAK